ncbi:MAG: FGGY-family carbohydrate kinase [Rhizobiales bacterium]|nr:FGGY-family carbohydrate kinase [Hyphomicrobiales bacterium]
MTDVALGIDIGTSGVRIVAVNSSGKIEAMSAKPIIAPLQGFGRILQDPAIWWDATSEALRALDLKGLTVRAIAVDGTSGTILPVAENGTPLGLASMYNDVAEPSDLAKVKAAASPDTAALGSTSPLARALPMAANAERILHQADWIAGQFSGRFDSSDENNALKTGYDPVARRWPEWVEKTGIEPAKLPNVVPAGTKIGTIMPEAAKAFGLPSDTAIVAGTTDGCAAFLASGASEAGDGVTSLGTTLTIKLLSATPVFAPAFGIYSHRIGDRWLAGGASNTGGAVLVKHFRKVEIVELSKSIDPSKPTGFDYYPLNEPGERFPVNDPGFAPRLTPVPEDRKLFLQAILEGIAAVESLGYAKLAELGASPLVSIRTVGGGAGNEAWTKLRLAALKVPAKQADNDQAAAGAARLAWRGIGHAY